MDIQAMVWGAYLEVLQEAGTRLTLQEVLDLQEHQERVLDAAHKAVQHDAAGFFLIWDQPALWDD